MPSAPKRKKADGEGSKPAKKKKTQKIVLFGLAKGRFFVELFIY